MAIDAATVRKVAKLAHIREPEDRLEPLAQELSGILQLDRAAERGRHRGRRADDLGGRRRSLPMREDVVTEGGDAGAMLANAPKTEGRLLRGAQGGGMSDLTSLTLKDALDGLKAKRFSSAEITQAHIGAIEAARRAERLRAGDAGEGAGHGQGRRRPLARGEAGPLEGAPLGIKDLFCTEGVRSTAGSQILGDFKPTYESTVTANLWRDGAVMLGKLNMDEFAMGSSNETSAFGPVVNPWRSRGEQPAR